MLPPVRTALPPTVCLPALLALLCLVAFGFAEPSTRPAVVEAADAASLKDRVGERVTVTGVVSRAAWSRSGKVMNVEFERADADAFGLALFERDRGRFDAAFNGDVAATLTGATVRIRGEVTEYGGRSDRYAGRPEMILREPSQITIVTPATRPAGSAD